MLQRIIQPIIFWLLIIHIIALSTSINKNTTKSIESYRLPVNVTRPIAYTLDLNVLINENDQLFRGNVTIDVEAITNSSTITLNAHQLNILNVTLVNLQVNQSIVLGDVQYNNVTDQLTIPLRNAALQPNIKYKLSIIYVGSLQKDVEIGIYKSSYITANGQVRWYASTKFEPTFARYAFPCYDEPQFKAPISIRITHSISYNAISNMPVEMRTNNTDGTATTTFKSTQLAAPTYSIGFHVSDFIERTSKRNGDAPIRIICRSDAVGDFDFILNTALDLLHQSSRYLGVWSAWNKLDIIAVPNMSAAAWNNWGMLKFREEFLLLNNDSTYVDQQNVVLQLAHQIAHQWFGNLVTLEWWSQLWLNEAFARFFEFISIDMVFPQWLIRNTIVPNLIQPSFRYDIQENVRPMSHNVDSPQEIQKDFDPIAYNKGAAVLSMIQNSLTENTFNKALERYLRNASYDNVVEEDFFAALQYAAQEDGTLRANTSIAEIIHTWTHQSGYPVLYVMRDYANNTITLQQARHHINDNTNSAEKWWIPIDFTSAVHSQLNDQVPTQLWMPGNQMQMKLQSTDLTLVSPHNWILFNKKATGYYRVRYDDINYGYLSGELNFGNFTNIDTASRSQILDDAFEFAKYGKLRYDMLLNITQYLHRERQYAPWVAATYGFRYINRRIMDSEQYPLFQKFIRNIAEPTIEYLGYRDFNGETILNKALRSDLIQLACAMNSTSCLQNTSAILDNFITNQTEIHPNLRDSIYCGAYRSNSTKYQQFFWARLENTTDVRERNRIISALGCTSEMSKLIDLLKRTVSTNAYFQGPDERFTALQSVMENSREGINTMPLFILSNIFKIFGKYGQSNLNKAIVNSAEFVVNDDLQKKFRMACESKFIAQDVCQKALTSIEQNNQWVDQNLGDIENWLRKEMIPKSMATTIINRSFYILTIGLILSIRNIFV